MIDRFFASDAEVDSILSDLLRQSPVKTESWTPPRAVQAAARQIVSKYGNPKDDFEPRYLYLVAELAEGKPVSKLALETIQDQLEATQVTKGDAWEALGGTAGLRWVRACLRKAQEEFEVRTEVFKVDKDKRVVYGWATVVSKDGEEVVDRQGDIISEQDMESAAWEFTAGDGKSGEMHERIVGDVVASMPFTTDLQKALGINLGKVGWLVGLRIKNDEAWSKVKDGTYKQLSIHGKGRRTKVA